jgi:hypothetical protein
MTSPSVRNLRPVGGGIPADQADRGARAEHGDDIGRRVVQSAAAAQRDEKVGMTGGVRSSRVQQGARDLKRGLRDTTRAPGADAAYRKLKE